jgi:deazaflavin-dependent oxidoreductase (nitroreductase family)
MPPAFVSHDAPAGAEPRRGHGERPVRAAYRRLVERLGHTRWFAAALRSIGARVDARIYRLSGGRLSIAGPVLFPVLLLTTTGRRSGRPRTTPLIYVEDGEALVVSSESFGQKRPAAWPLNLAADPRATVQIGTRRRAYVGRPATPAEVERHWPELLAAWPPHETYLGRSGVRKVYVLTPADPS